MHTNRALTHASTPLLIQFYLKHKKISGAFKFTLMYFAFFFFCLLHIHCVYGSVCFRSYCFTFHDISMQLKRIKQTTRTRISTISVKQNERVHFVFESVICGTLTAIFIDIPLQRSLSLSLLLQLTFSNILSDGSLLTSKELEKHLNSFATHNCAQFTLFVRITWYFAICCCFVYFSHKKNWLNAKCAAFVISHYERLFNQGRGILR